MENGQYYLGRVIKLGQLNQERLMNAIVECSPMLIRKFSWAITDVIDRRSENLPYVFGKLSKYASEGAVTIVDENEKHQVPAIAKNLLIASAPFVYLPDYSGIAFLHVWNEIQEDVFRRRFKALIEATYHGFFVECSIEPVADYREFITKLSEINRINSITAKVNPPNPLFGRIWKELWEYITKRNASEVLVREQGQESTGLRSDLKALVEGTVEGNIQELKEPVSISDAALLMAADGYGQGKVVGEVSGAKVTIKTSDSKKSITFPKEPDDLALAEAANEEFSAISRERGMEHP